MIAPELPQAAVEVQFAGLGAFDHRRKISSRAARKMLLRLGRDDGEDHGGHLTPEDPTGLAPKGLGDAQFVAQVGSGGVHDIAPIGIALRDMGGQTRGQLQ